VLPSAFQYLSSLLSLHSPEHVSDVERVNRCKTNNSTVEKIGKKIAGEDSMRRSAISVRESKKRGQQSEKE
jgi:hypothetical protein